MEQTSDRTIDSFSECMDGQNLKSCTALQVLGVHLSSHHTKRTRANLGQTVVEMKFHQSPSKDAIKIMFIILLSTCQAVYM